MKSIFMRPTWHGPVGTIQPPKKAKKTLDDAPRSGLESAGAAIAAAVETLMQSLVTNGG
jgi:hypothetical protein